MIQNNELQHFGVKGMKWGVRHDKVSSGARRAKGAAKKEVKNFVTNQKIKAQRKAAYRNRSNMSDDEIRKMTNRINAENNLRNAINQSDSSSQTRQQIKTAITGVVVSSAIAGATAYATSGNGQKAISTLKDVALRKATKVK